MARIRDASPKESSGGYGRLLGNLELGNLITKIHSTSISAGSKLEKIIESRVSQNKIDNVYNIKDLDDFLNSNNVKEGVYLANKKKIKNCKKFLNNKIEIDFLIFEIVDKDKKCFVIELKDGHLFDTKKAEKEIENLKKFTELNKNKISYILSEHIVSFNKSDKEDIIKGFKNKISIQEAMTGEEFCNKLKIDYKEIIEFRKESQRDNMDYVMEQLYNIVEVRSFFKNRISLLNKLLKTIGVKNK